MADFDLNKLIEEIEPGRIAEFYEYPEEIGFLIDAVSTSLALPESYLDHSEQDKKLLRDATIALIESILRTRPVTMHITRLTSKGEAELIPWTGTIEKALDFIRSRWDRLNGNFDDPEDWICFSIEEIPEDIKIILAQWRKERDEELAREKASAPAESKVKRFLSKFKFKL